MTVVNLYTMCWWTVAVCRQFSNWFSILFETSDPITVRICGFTVKPFGQQQVLGCCVLSSLSRIWGKQELFLVTDQNYVQATNGKFKLTIGEPPSALNVR